MLARAAKPVADVMNAANAPSVVSALSVVIGVPAIVKARASGPVVTGRRKGRAVVRRTVRRVVLGLTTVVVRVPTSAPITVAMAARSGVRSSPIRTRLSPS